MTPDKVQSKREKHPQKSAKQKEMMQNRESTSTSSSSMTCSQSPPSLPISPIPFRIVSRDNSNIAHVVSKWVNIQDQRSRLYGRRMDEMTYYDTCLATKLDTEMMWNVIEFIFPQLDMLTNWDKDALLRNFHPKWAFLVSAIDLNKYPNVHDNIKSADDYFDLIIKFVSSSIHEEHQLEPKEILKIFEPLFRYYGIALSIPISEKRFNAVEYMAIALLIFFDGAHTNFSPECSELCYNIKNLVLRELRGYYVDQNIDEMRFIETIDVLQLMQKGEQKFQEELLLCEMYNVHIHDDYRLMIRELNY